MIDLNLIPPPALVWQASPENCPYYWTSGDNRSQFYGSHVFLQKDGTYVKMYACLTPMQKKFADKIELHQEYMQQQGDQRESNFGPTAR